MARRILVQGVAAAFAAVLVPGTAWSEPAAGATESEQRPSSEIIPAGSGPSGAIVADRSELLREWGTRRDKRPHAGAHPVGAVLAGGVALSLIAVSERIASMRARRSVRWTVRTLGARSPPLQPA